jgi:uncharacterized protein with ParB-like and HNH nuclease domain
MDVKDKIKVTDPSESEGRSEDYVFTISSHGADYPAELIAKRVNDGVWYVPNFQRNFVWTLRDASRFIESLLIGLPVPGIFLFKEVETGRFSIIDGQQRCVTLDRFINGKEFNNKVFRLSGVRPEFNGKSFKELTPVDQNRLNDSLVHSTIFQQIAPDEDDKSSVYEVFERINTGGSKLSSQEIRTCVNFGEFALFLEELTEVPGWKEVYPSKSKRLKDHELILRYLAFRFPIKPYKKGLRKYLDDYMEAKRDISDLERVRLKDDFVEMINFIGGQLGPRAFRRNRNFNAAIYDSVSVGVAGNLANLIVSGVFIDEYSKLLDNDEFIDAISKATSNEDQLKKRFELANAAFAK